MKDISEDYMNEFKDFSSIREESKQNCKKITRILLKEICAFSNSENGGCIHVGLNDEGIPIKQQNWQSKITNIEYLENKCNDCFIGIVSLSIERSELITKIHVSPARTVIEVRKDISNDMKLGDVFIRKSSSSVKAKANEISNLIRQRENDIGPNEYEMFIKLSSIVQSKLKRKPKTNELNVFDSLLVRLSSPSEKAVKWMNMQFEHYMFEFFCLGGTPIYSSEMTFQLLNIQIAQRDKSTEEKNYRRKLIEIFNKDMKLYMSLRTSWYQSIFSSVNYKNYVLSFDVVSNYK